MVNFLTQAYFILIIKSKAENHLQFQQHSVPAQRARTTVKQIRHETPDFIMAPNLWLLNTCDCSPVDYRILAMLHEWVNILREMLIS